MSAKKAQIQAAERRLAKLGDYKNVFGSAQGQRVLWDLMQAHHVLTPTIFKGASHEEVLHREGERNVVLRILTLLKEDPGKLLERIEREKKNDNSEQWSE